MRIQPKLTIAFALILVMLVIFSSSISSDAASSSSSICGRVIDANTGSPIENATIIVWDLNTLGKPRLGAGIYFTDKRGEYNLSGPYLKTGHTYWIYAYKGNFTAKTVDYVPVIKKLERFESSREVSFSLIPGALIELEGTPYLVQSSSLGGGRISIKVLSKTELNASFINQYGDGVDAWFLGLSRSLVIVPANVPVDLEANIWFFVWEQTRIRQEVFTLRSGSSPFMLHQGSKESCQISSYSLRRGLEFVKSKLTDVSSQIDEAQDIGFVVFEERRSLANAEQRRIEAETILTSAQDDGDYLKSWSILRDVLGTMNLVSRNLENMRLVSKTSAVYLSAIMATFSIVLAFFFFEERRKKMFSSVLIYIIFLVILYFSYPGAHIIIDENALLFLESAVFSFLGVSALVFGLPRVWKERKVEGEVSARSAISIIFSMGKREIRRKRIRGFFTILSIIILILAFTSLTSFGTVFGIVSEKLSATAPSDGVMVKRMLNETSLLFSPLGSDDPVTLSRIMKINNVALRLKNIPSSNPIARLSNSKKSWFIYGIVGVTPTNESMYTHLDETVEYGGYLSETRDDEILISMSVASNLNIKVGENVTLEMLGAGVSSSFIVSGMVNDEKYMSLVDMDGKPFGPTRLLSDGSLRTCNSTEVIIMGVKAVEKLQEMANMRYPEGAPQIALLSDITFQPGEGMSIDSIVRTLIFVFNYDVSVSSNKIITYYHIGSYREFKGAAELLIPLVMVGFNVGMVMLNSVYERRREIRTLSMLGLNPTHIGSIFVAEAIILGMVGGSLGYLLGLGFYRIMVLFGQELMVREKLDWWWSAIAFAIAILASVLSAIRPAALAVSTYTPSKVKRIKISEEEAKVRKEEIFKAYQARELSMPVKVKLNEKEFFLGLFLDRLDELKTGYLERVENIEDIPEIENVKGELIKAIKFDYRFEAFGQERRTRNSLMLTKSPKEDSYRVKLVSKPAVLGTPESAIDRTIDFVHEIVLHWAKDRERIIGI